MGQRGLETEDIQESVDLFLAVVALKETGREDGQQERGVGGCRCEGFVPNETRLEAAFVEKREDIGIGEFVDVRR